MIKDKFKLLLDKLNNIDKERVYNFTKGSLRLITVLGATGVLRSDKKVVRVANEATDVLDRLEHSGGH